MSIHVRILRAPTITPVLSPRCSRSHVLFLKAKLSRSSRPAESTSLEAARVYVAACLGDAGWSVSRPPEPWARRRHTPTTKRRTRTWQREQVPSVSSPLRAQQKSSGPGRPSLSNPSPYMVGPYFRFCFYSFRIRRYSSIQLATCRNPCGSTGYMATSQFSFFNSMRRCVSRTVSRKWTLESTMPWAMSR